MSPAPSRRPSAKPPGKAAISAPLNKLFPGGFCSVCLEIDILIERVALRGTQVFIMLLIGKLMRAAAIIADDGLGVWVELTLQSVMAATGLKETEARRQLSDLVAAGILQKLTGSEATNDYYRWRVDKFPSVLSVEKRDAANAKLADKAERRKLSVVPLRAAAPAKIEAKIETGEPYAAALPEAVRGMTIETLDMAPVLYDARVEDGVLIQRLRPALPPHSEQPIANEKRKQARNTEPKISQVTDSQGPLEKSVRDLIGTLTFRSGHPPEADFMGKLMQDLQHKSLDQWAANCKAAWKRRPANSHTAGLLRTIAQALPDVRTEPTPEEEAAAAERERLEIARVNAEQAEIARRPPMTDDEIIADNKRLEKERQTQ